MIYLNNAASSFPKALGVAEAMDDALRKPPASALPPGSVRLDVFSETCKELALVMGVGNPSHIQLCGSTEEALKMVLQGLELSKEDTVLTTVGEQAMLLESLSALAQETGVSLHHIPVDETGRISAEEWRGALQRYAPRLCVIAHASLVTGAVNDAQLLTKLAHNHEALMLLDVSSTLGYTKVELEAWGVDLATFAGHRYLLGPQGTGGLYAKPGIELGTHGAGTNNEPGYHGLLQALKWQRVDPWPRADTEDLLTQLKSQLKALGAMFIDPGANSIPLVSFTTKGLVPETLAQALSSDYGIVTQGGRLSAPRVFEFLGVKPSEGVMRVSLSRFSTPQEIDAFGQALHELIAAGVAHD